MTERYIALTVTLEHPLRSDDAEEVIKAIGMIKGVQGVVPVVSNVEVYWAKENARSELRQKIWNLLEEP